MNNEIIYEIYPLTFNYAAGSESDPYKGAYGNLKGITEMADYVKSIGVDTAWIAPFYKWNKTGMGYDIIDYYNVDPMFGTNNDFKELVDVYHQKGLRVIVDQVYNHCSQEHEWFKKSIKREEPYTDYFVWADAKGYDENGKPVVPNNWPSTWDSSGESVWAWNEERQQFYMHSFDVSMPNLNINNPKVRTELLNVARHWLDMGVDGFRLDGSCHYGYDPRLLDNPLLPNGEQMRIYDINHKIGCSFLDEIQDLTNSYAGKKTLLSEYVFDKGRYGNAKGKNTIRDSICSAFYIGSLKGGLADFPKAVEAALAVSPKGKKLNWALSNHDLERVASRFFGEKYSQKKSVMLMDMLTTLPGSICLFQGEELGLPNPRCLENAKNRKNDPREVWLNAGMPWDGARGGFCKSFRDDDVSRNMSLRPTPEQRILAVDRQEKLPDSMLNQTRRLLKRRNESFLKEYGDVKFFETGNDEVIAFSRSNQEGKYKVFAYNFSEKNVKVKIPLANGHLSFSLPAETSHETKGYYTYSRQNLRTNRGR